MSRSRPKLPAWLRISIRVRKRARQRVKCGIFPTLEKPSNLAGAYPRVVRRPFLRTEPDSRDDQRPSCRKIESLYEPGRASSNLRVSGSRLDEPYPSCLLA